ncbi:MAG TPA: heme ABC exporter ATP-binding protein CcmA [Thermoflexia bacterium]|jgi:heme exporter protein A|nr:heme ABC exporter ATP-binding protein CcmA [Thermoflexia bacterium]
MSGPNPPTMIEVHGLTKSFGPRVALAGVDLTVAQGEFVTLVGPNGAGKTTFLRILAMLTRPTSGTVRVAGLDPARAGEEARRRIGFLSHRTLLYEDLTAEQNLRFYARMYGLKDGAARIDDLLERVGLAHRRHDLVRTFSRGMQQRLAVARAVLHQPQLLLLDEPYTGLDPEAAQALTDLLVGLVGEGCTILLTTHNLERGLSVGRRVVVLAHGRVVYDEPREAIDPLSFPETYRRVVAS